jgi:hypothetical protein
MSVTFALDPVEILAGAVLQGHLGAHSSSGLCVQLMLLLALSFGNDWHAWPGRSWVL